VDQFHHCMGYISPDITKKLIQNGFVTGVKLESSTNGNLFFCELYVYAKVTWEPIAKSQLGEHATDVGRIIHSDLWGPALVETKGGKWYYVTYSDNHTSFAKLDLLWKKSEQPTAYKKLEAWYETQLDVCIKVLCSDAGGEYKDKEFIEYLKSQGTEQWFTVHNTPEHNGIAERQNQTIFEHVQALLHVSSLSKNLWGEAAHHIVWLMNRTLTKAVEGMTPYKALFGKKPDLKNVHKWGEKVWVHVEGAGDKLGG